MTNCEACGNNLNMSDETQMGEVDSGDRITGCVSGKVERRGVCEHRRAFSHESARGQMSCLVRQTNSKESVTYHTSLLISP